MDGGFSLCRGHGIVSVIGWMIGFERIGELFPLEQRLCSF